MQSVWDPAQSAGEHRPKTSVTGYSLYLKVTFILLIIIVLIKISIRIRQNTNYSKTSLSRHIPSRS